MSPRPTPQQLAEKVLAILEESADEASARQLLRFFKPHEKVRLYGIKAPELRAIVKKIYAEIKAEWTVADAIELCSLLIARPFLECKAFGLIMLSRFQKWFEPGLLVHAKTWLMNNYSDNWATTDALSTLIVAPLIEKFPELIPQIKSWTKSENLWVRRTAAVSFVPFARKGKYLDVAYEIAEQLLLYEEDLIHKATGWLLREAGKTDPDRLESFLLQHGSDVSRTALRYAIEKFPDDKRKQLLKQC